MDVNSAAGLWFPQSYVEATVRNLTKEGAQDRLGHGKARLLAQRA